jgi:hypothetical protein
MKKLPILVKEIVLSRQDNLMVTVEREREREREKGQEAILLMSVLDCVNYISDRSPENNLSMELYFYQYIIMTKKDGSFLCMHLNLHMDSHNDNGH